jgi:membrane-bound lytic murein transglycosylase F
LFMVAKVIGELMVLMRKINALKKLKINYLLIGIVTLLLAAALWPSIPWSGS